MDDRPMPEAVAVGTSDCGAACTLGDLVGEFALVAIPGAAAVFGLGWLFDDHIFAAWVLDFVLTYLFGIAFQYFSIAPMRDLSVGQGVWAAVKADTFSITARQIGIYGIWPIHLTGVVLVGGSPGSSGRRALQARRVATSARWLHAVRSVRNHAWSPLVDPG